VALSPTDKLIAWLNDDTDLLAAAPGGVWEDPGPLDEDERPFVTVRLLSGLPQHCGGGSRTLDCLYAVKAVGQADAIAAVRVAQARIEALIGASGRVLGRHDLAGFAVMGSWPESVIEFTDPEATTGVRYEHRGANYRMQLEALAA
jgi:hypothetical protein